MINFFHLGMDIKQKKESRTPIWLSFKIQYPMKKLF